MIIVIFICFVVKDDKKTQQILQVVNSRFSQQMYILSSIVNEPLNKILVKETKWR